MDFVNFVFTGARFLKCDNFYEICKNLQISQFPYLEKSVLELHRAATLQPRKIERSDFFLLDRNGQT